MDGPDQIGPDTGPKRTISDRFGRLVRSFTTKYILQPILEKNPILIFL